MIVVLAGRGDAAARWLAASWAARTGGGADLLTPGDRSRAGWRHFPGAPADYAAVVGGRSVPQAEITGVYTRLGYVVESELSHVLPAERGYVAAEMTAFLLSWLSALRCPVLNRPTASSLSGPFWRPEQWLHAAARAGVPVAGPVRRRAAPGEAPGGPAGGDPAASASVTVIGDRCIVEGRGRAAGKTLCEHARRLARAAGVALLTVRFAERAPGVFVFAGADPGASSLPECAEAIFAHLTSADGRETP